MLNGNVSSPMEAQTAFDIASRLTDDGKKVVNSINVIGAIRSCSRSRSPKCSAT